MRSLLIAASMVTGVADAGVAQAGQQMVAHGPGGAMATGPATPGQAPMAGGQMASRGSAPRHWGGMYQGHWVGGVHAPGGWAGYRQPYRGFGLPAYWTSPAFVITDWRDYGLYQPPVGYSWSRYYDDAVLIDGRGSVFNTVGGIDWPSYDLDVAQGGAMSGGYASADAYRGVPGAGYDYPPQDGSYPPRRSGVGGALVGGAVGGVAGGLIAGRGDKVGGALIGAGAGALTGYVIDRSAHRRDYPPQSFDPGAGYPMPGSRFAPPTVVQNGGTTVVTTSSGYFPGSTMTTVTVESAPVVTTTTEVFEDDVTYTRRAPRRVYHKRVWRRPVCSCR